MAQDMKKSQASLKGMMGAALKNQRGHKKVLKTLTGISPVKKSLDDILINIDRIQPDGSNLDEVKTIIKNEVATALKSLGNAPKTLETPDLKGE